MGNLLRRQGTHSTQELLLTTPGPRVLHCSAAHCRGALPSTAPIIPVNDAESVEVSDARRRPAEGLCVSNAYMACVCVLPLGAILAVFSMASRR